MPDKAMKLRDVCVVTERGSRGQEALYGVFDTEANARRDYGDEVEGYTVSFDVVPLFTVLSGGAVSDAD